MHTWATIIKDHDDNVELEELEDDFTLIVDTETEGNNNKLFVEIDYHSHLRMLQRLLQL